MCTVVYICHECIGPLIERVYNFVLSSEPPESADSIHMPFIHVENPYKKLHVQWQETNDMKRKGHCLWLDDETKLVRVCVFVCSTVMSTHLAYVMNKINDTV